MSRIAVTFAPDALPDAARRRLLVGLVDHDVVFARAGGWSNLTPAASEHTHDADLIYGQPAVPDLAHTRAHWVQLTSAGYGRYDPEALARRGIALTTSSSVYARPVAESALAMLLGAFRRLPHALADQPARRWDPHTHRRRAGLVHGSKVVVLGWGAIGKALVPMLQVLGADVVVVRQRVRGDEPMPTVGVSSWLEALLGTEALVNTLPGTAATARMVGSEALGRLAPGAVLVNVGRGTTVDQVALVEALESGHLGGAWLDVTDPEPLPPEHPLWSTERVWIAPHVAGGWQGEHVALVEHFLANLARWEAGEALVDRRG